MLLACLAFSFNFMACTDDDGDGDDDQAEGTLKEFFSDSYASGWQYFSFAKGDFVNLTAEQAESSLDWDIAFNRYYVKTNSGTSGKGKGGLFDSGAATFDAATVNADSEFVEDDSLNIMTTMGSFAKESYNPGVECEGSNSWAWYKYKEGNWYYNHNIFVVRTADGESYAKITFDTYKDALNNSGHIQFRYKYEEGDRLPSQRELTVSVMKQKWNYFSFSKGEFLDITDEEAMASSEWDFAIDRFYIRTNSGTSGNGKGGALDTKKTKFSDVATISIDGYKVDKECRLMTDMGKFEQVSASPAYVCEETEGAWYSSAAGGKDASMNNNIFVIKTADGNNYAKVVMKSYESERMQGKITFEYIYPAK